MESEKFICVRETGATNQLLVVEVGGNTPPARRPITADSAIMNPNRKIIALKAAAQVTGGGNSLQVFDLESKTKLKAFAMSENVVYWRWISGSKIGMVTGTAVYHWDIEVRTHQISSFDVFKDTSDPVKVFDRAQNLTNTQIISYKVGAAGKWCVLIGIGPGSAER